MTPGGKLPRSALPSFVLQKTFVPSQNKIKCDGGEQRKVKEMKMMEKNENAGLVKGYGGKTNKLCHLPLDLQSIHATTHYPHTHIVLTKPQTQTHHLSWCLGTYLAKLSSDLSHSSPA